MAILEKMMLSRRQALGLGTAAAATLGLAACGGSSTPSADSGSAAGSAAESAVSIDTAAFDALVAGGPTAADDVIGASEWAQKVKDAGKLRVGCVSTSELFSQLNEVDGRYRGFDAGLWQLLARYITGDDQAFEPTTVTSSTRESVLENDDVDAVFATYSINDERKEVISFAGPYYISQYGVMVKADSGIKTLEDLKGKKVAAQSGSNGPELVEQYLPDAELQEMNTDEEIVTALDQGRIDAYAVNTDIILGTTLKSPGKYVMLDETFGPEDPYGIGLPKDSDGVQFVNDWLKGIEDDGTWAELWKITLGEDNIPDEPPAIEA
jgi:glutamate transport system substrate-binding protein